MDERSPRHRGERDGMVWVESELGGYWLSEKLKAARDAAGGVAIISNSCRLCNGIPSRLRKSRMSDINKWGVCTQCVVLWIDSDESLQNLKSGELLPLLRKKKARIEAQIRDMPKGPPRTFLMSKYKLDGTN